MTDLWTEASAPIEAEEAALRMAAAKVSVAGIWPFLAMAQSESEFRHRLALALPRIAATVPSDLLEPVEASLHEDFRVLSGKDAKGEEAADDKDGDGMPDWLKSKIDSKESAFFHQGLGRWVAIGYRSFDPSNNPSRSEVEAEDDAARPRSTEEPDEDADEEASWRDLGRRGPSEARRTAAYWHRGAGRWVIAEVEDHEGGGNPWYFTGGPEGGPNTGQTNQFAPSPTVDPVDPIQGMFPMQPSPWVVPPGGEWRESPMNFNPPGGGYHPASRRRADVQPNFYEEQAKHGLPGWPSEMEVAPPNETNAHEFGLPHGSWPYHGDGSNVQHYDPDKHDQSIRSMNTRHQGAKVGDRDRCDDCGLPIRFVAGDGQRWWSHTGQHGAMADDDHLPQLAQKIEKNHPRSDSIHHRYTNPVSGARHLGEGAAGNQGKNPNYFAGGPEGVSGEQSGSFPEDVAAGVDPDDRVNELYDHMNPGPMADSGDHVARRRTANEDHPPPASDALQGTRFDSEQERQRYEIARNPDAQQASRDSTALTGARRGQFFDPADPSIRTVAAGGFGPDDNPFSVGQNGGPGGDDADPFGGGGMGSQMTVNVPQTTPPRQMPSGGGGADFGGDETEGGDPTSKEGRLRRHAESREIADDENPSGYGDEYEANVYEKGGPLATRPRQPAEHRMINTPQTPAEPIRTNTSSEPRREEERVASIAAHAIRELVTR